MILLIKICDFALSRRDCCKKKTSFVVVALVAYTMMKLSIVTALLCLPLYCRSSILNNNNKNVLLEVSRSSIALARVHFLFLQNLTLLTLFFFYFLNFWRSCCHTQSDKVDMVRFATNNKRRQESSTPTTSTRTRLEKTNTPTIPSSVVCILLFFTPGV
jgi:hypothetical protein